MKYFIYAISSLEYKYIYVGLTKNLKNRIYRHNAGQEKITRFYAPFKLIYIETADSLATARMSEKYFKSGIGKKFLKKILKHGAVVELVDTQR